jgi:predicted lipid-binding transport protein (Tim44 family)
VKPVVPPARPVTQQGPAPASRPAPVKPAAPARETTLARKTRPAGKTAAPAAPPAEGSVSDRLQKLSGRGYDLYQDRFLAQARPAIRKILGAGRGLFFTLPEKAEDLVYGYLKDHYADPYMNWAASDEFRQLAEQGFRLPSLDPVIDECFRRIK